MLAAQQPCAVSYAVSCFAYVQHYHTFAKSTTEIHTRSPHIPKAYIAQSQTALESQRYSTTSLQDRF